MVDQNDYSRVRREDNVPYVSAQCEPLYTTRKESRPRQRKEKPFYTDEELILVRSQVRFIDSIVG